MAWTNISLNDVIQWTASILEKHHDKMDITGLSSQPNIAFTDALIERFAHLWDWHELTANTSIEWSDEQLEKYKDRIDWHELSRSHDFKRTFKNIKIFKDKWFFELLESSPNYHLAVGIQPIDDAKSNNLVQVLMLTLNTEEQTGASFITPYSTRLQHSFA